ncbi:hypothetical protein [Dipodfec virus UA06Rod_20]|uniref:Uncharacterized protein n=1 Tax=Dipodfec virus UA06Rod_20 TaxID=2929320 RepID=A0A976N1X9_9VIRU|nr:hypothetical protein [Dipodfec virus UA06Rod_20]
MIIRRLQYRGDRVPEVGDPTSETIPDQALTVRDIITRFTRGQIEIPPFETGDPDDIDDAVDYGDIVDAAEDFERGASLYSSLSDSVDYGQKDKDTSQQVAETSDSSSE